jgi:uncharacterized protein YecE (DUF72 family)
VTVAIGTSGWHYRHWKGCFYPERLPSSGWLGYYSGRFATVEVNNAFYRLPERSTFESWRSTVPDGFVVAVKASRYITHVKRLRDPVEPVGRLVQRVAGLGDRMGPILLQLPPNLAVDVSSLDATLAAFDRKVRLAVEVRHSSWLVEEVRSVLESRGAALCMADGGPLDVPVWRTADFGYIRFHHGAGSPESCYTRSALDTWAKRLAERWSAGEDIYCYFNNDGHCCALRDARWLALAVARHGLEPTRVPASGDVRVN